MEVTNSDSSETPHALTLKAAQETVDQWIETIGVRYFDEMTNLAQLVEEVGEVARILSRTCGEQSYKKGQEPGDLADELADVLFVTICLANQSGINLTDAFHRNLAKKTGRDATRHHENPKLSIGSKTTGNE
ncbi:MAG: nucleotide pyrophosphohydrolase [Planctomycetota bacterium]|nr:nucleotide pyrophosphohydrolase [Planctomycetota bacterium]